MSVPAVGFLGLGRIGAPMALRLAGAGFSLVVYDIVDEAMRPFAGKAVLGTSADDLATRCDIVIGCLQTLEQYRAAILGADGLIHGARVRSYVHVGTTGAALVRELAGALAARGVRTLDAPMSGGVAGALHGTLVTMAAGQREIYDDAHPLLEAWSRSVIYLGGEPGLAQTMKLVNNMLSAANLAAAVEVMAVGAQAGIDADTMLEVLNHGTGQNSATLTKVPRDVLTRRFDTGSTLANVEKDLSAYAEAARHAGIDSALCGAVLGAYLRAGAQGSMQDDISTVARPFERDAGVTLETRRPPQ